MSRSDNWLDNCQPKPAESDLVADIEERIKLAQHFQRDDSEEIKLLQRALTELALVEPVIRDKVLKEMKANLEHYCGATFKARHYNSSCDVEWVVEDEVIEAIEALKQTKE